MKYWKSAVLFSFILLFMGCAKAHTKTVPLKPQDKRPVGFWENENSVVQVMHTYKVNTLDIFSGQVKNEEMTTLGTGFVVNINGVVFTNHHAVVPTNLPANSSHVPDSDKIEVCKVVAGVQNCVEAKVMDTDVGHDFALLIAVKLFDRPVTFADDHTLKLGAEIYLWGNIHGWAPPSPMVGRFVNWIAEPYVKQEMFGPVTLPLLILDISFVEGSSGGPTFDSLGRCIGQNRFFTTSGGRSIALSTPSSAMMKFLDDNKVEYKVEKE